LLEKTKEEKVMKALRSQKTNAGVTSRVEDIATPQLAEGSVLIRAEYSGLNYKDALGVTGKGSIFKTLPITGGIDVSGTVEQSLSPAFKKGDFVLVNGGGLGETHDGGYAEFVVEKAENIVLRAKTLSAREAMIYGTAGFTAALCLERLLQNGQTPEKGPILVTGASGGVGQFAVTFFAKMGFEVHALTGKRELASRLEAIGAKKVIFTSQLELGSRPLESVRYGGAIDNIGGATLAGVLAHTQLWGNVASVGLASSHELHASVMPFILRGVSLIGISSNNTPRDLRIKIWERLATELKPEKLEDYISQVIRLEDVPDSATKMLNRESHGRTLIEF
jgi:acrylyl-CoA reductase (NADPH)